MIQSGLLKIKLLIVILRVITKKIIQIDKYRKVITKESELNTGKCLNTICSNGGVESQKRHIKKTKSQMVTPPCR